MQKYTPEEEGDEDNDDERMFEDQIRGTNLVSRIRYGVVLVMNVSDSNKQRMHFIRSSVKCFGLLIA